MEAPADRVDPQPPPVASPLDQPLGSQIADEVYSAINQIEHDRGADAARTAAREAAYGILAAVLDGAGFETMKADIKNVCEALSRRFPTTTCALDNRARAILPKRLSHAVRVRNG
jgi:hypothetical protein